MRTVFGKKINYFVIAGMVLLLILALAVYKYSVSKKVVSENVPYVRTMIVGQSTASQNYTYPGEVHGRYESQLAFQVSGKIVRRNVDLGSVVNPGDILMTIDSKDIQQTVNSASAQIYSAESQLRLAESNLKRYRQLYQDGVVGRMTYDQYVNAYDLAVAAVRQATAQYAQGANQLDYSMLRADKPGVISGIVAEVGQVVGAGQPVVTVVQDGEREVEINVPENRIEELREAQRLKVTFWALPNVTVDGKVREVAPMADQATRTYKVRISILNPPPEIRLGMTAAVTLIHSSLPQNIEIPLSAIYHNGDTPAVWVVSDDKLALRPVKIGNLGNGTVQVLEGLLQGDRIVTAGVHKLKEGQKVRIGGESL